MAVSGADKATQSCVRESLLSVGLADVGITASVAFTDSIKDNIVVRRVDKELMAADPEVADLLVLIRPDFWAKMRVDDKVKMVANVFRRVVPQKDNAAKGKVKVAKDNLGRTKFEILDKQPRDERTR